MKKIIAMLLVILMAAALFAGCSGSGLDYIVTAKKNGETVNYSAKPYIYYLQWIRDYYYAYFTTAAAQMEQTLNWDNVLQSTTLTAPDTMSQFLVKSAKEQYLTYLYIQETFEELGLTLTAEDEAQVDAIIQQDWVGVYGYDKFNTIRQQLGFTYDEFRDLLACNIKSEKIVNYYFGEGGSKEITEDEMYDYFKNHYVRFKYIVFSTADSDGNKYKDEKLEAVKAQRDAALAELEGGASFEDVLMKYSEDYFDLTDGTILPSQKEAYEKQNESMVNDGLVIDEDGVFSEALASYYNISVDEDIVEQVFAMKDGEYHAVTIDGSIWIVKRYAVDEKESYFEGVQSMIFKALYSEDLVILQTTWRSQLDYAFNQAVLDKYPPESLTDLFDLAGTSSAS